MSPEGPVVLQPRSPAAAGTRHGAVGRRRPVLRHAGRGGLGVVADGVARPAVWHRRPDSRQGRRVLRLPAAVAGDDPGDAARPGGRRAGGHRGGLRRGRHRSASTPVRGLRVGPAARRHLSLLAAALLLVFAFGAWLDVPRLLVSSSGLLHGATNADVAVMIPALRVLLVAAVIGAGLALVQTRTVSWWPLLTAAALYGGVTAAGIGAAALMQRFVIGPNEQVRELPYIEHNIAATRAAFGLDTRRGARAVRRRAADARRHRRQRRHAGQRAALGPPAAAADLRADPGNPDVLRLRLGPQRPLQDQRRVPADHAVGARAQLREPAEPQLDQRAAHLHARLRRDAGPGEPGDAGRPAGAVHQGPAAAVVGGPHGHRAEHLLRPAVQRPRVREDEGPRVPLPEGRRQRLHHLRGAGRRADLELPAAACSSASASARSRCC